MASSAFYTSTVNKRRFQQTLLMAGAFCVSIFVLPSSSYDPVSIPKLYVLSLVCFISLGISLISRDVEIKLFRNKFHTSLVIFLLLLFLNLLVNNYALSERMLGISGRSTGFLTYLLLGIFAFQVYRYASMSSILWWLFLTKTVVGEIGRAHV